METNTILFCPVRQDAEILELALRSHAQLKGISERVYWDDNDTAESSELLNLEAMQYPNVRVLRGSIEAPKEAYNLAHQWTNGLVSRLAAIRNEAIKLLLASGADALFIVDSDLVLNPQLVQHLDSLHAPIVSEVFWSQWNPGELWMPNVWDIHPSGYFEPKRITRLKEPNAYEVGGLGACTLIRREVLASGRVNYSPIRGLETIWGEDRAFCTRATVEGYTLYADTNYPPFHVYRKSQLDEASAWFNTLGADPEYFREVWLTDEWSQAIENQLSAPANHLPRIAICIPGETFSSRWVMNTLDLVATAYRKGVARVFSCYSSNPSVTRQTLTAEVLGCNPPFDLVLWIDDDNVLSVEQFEEMLKTLETYPEIDAVAAWCFITQDGYEIPERRISAGQFDETGHAVSLTESDLKTEGLIRVDWTGFPAVIMRGKFLERLGPKSFQFLPDETGVWGFFGEDMSFCKRAQESGAVIVVDPRLCVPHLKLRDSNLPTLPDRTAEADPATPDISNRKES